MARQGDHFRRILAPNSDDIVFELCSFLEVYDIRTAYPLLLALLDAEIEDAQWKKISATLESYLLRRAVCTLGTKNYNRIFLALTRELRKGNVDSDRIRELLLAQSGESGVWPDDVAFRDAWLNKPLYGPLNSPKLIHLFERLNQTYMSSKSEALAFAMPPSVEHLMPQDWTANWRLPDGTKGMDIVELSAAKETDLRAVATRKREAAVQTLGNLTILSTGLNTAQSNLPWEQKKPAMMKHSLLPLNQHLIKKEVWDETAIRERGEELLKRALTAWPR